MTERQQQIAAAESAGLAWWIEITRMGTVFKSAPRIDGKLFSTHDYGGEKSIFQLGDCVYGCGCFMAETSSYGPVDPFGPCPKNPKTSVESAAVAVLHGKDVLLLKRGSTAPWMPNLWNFPGGEHTVPEETPMLAAIRECTEEAGFVPPEPTLIASILVDGAYMVHFFLKGL